MQIPIVKYLVEIGVNINKESKNGNTPLFDACRSGNLNLVKYLVEIGENINKENNNGSIVLFAACGSGSLMLVKFLVEIGANINKEKMMVEHLFLVFAVMDISSSLSI